MSRAARKASRETKLKLSANERRREREINNLVLIENERDARLEYLQNKKKFLDFKPRNKNQELYLDYIKENRLTFALGPAGTGKAQPLDSPIYTPDGWKLMGDIQIGDEVYTQDGSITKVNGVYPQGKKDIYRITFQDGRQTECCGEHLWKICHYHWGDKGNNFRVKNTLEIIELLKKPEYNKRLYVPSVQHPILQNKNFYIHPYILGIILGDGYFGGNVMLTNSSDFIVSKIRNLLPEDMELAGKGGTENQYRFRIKKELSLQFNPFNEEFKRLGLYNTRSATKFIPEEYIDVSEEQKWQLLNGLFDTDGTVDKTGSIQYCSVSLKLALQIQYLIRSLGGKCKIREKEYFLDKNKSDEKRISFILNVRITNPERLFTLPRKRDRILPPESYNHPNIRIENIEKIGNKYAQCISVEHPSHLYVTNDFIVTHNTFISTLHACELLESEQIERILITRPMVGCDENFGYLPGTEEEKYIGWVGPILEILEARLGKKRVKTLIEYDKICLKPLMMMRGSTFREAFVILDEAQNTTVGQMKMFLTRIGEGSKIVINGDIEQTDLKEGTKSGLEDAVERLRDSRIVKIVEFTENDIVRDPLVREIVRVYRKKK